MNMNWLKFDNISGPKRFSDLTRKEKIIISVGSGFFLLIGIITLLLLLLMFSNNDEEEIVNNPISISLEASLIDSEIGLVIVNTEAFPTEEIVTLNANRSAKYPAHPMYLEVNENKCLAMNIYYEARNQTAEGQYAVAFVTLNRLQLPEFPDNVCDVVYQKTWSKYKRRFIAQFSWVTCKRCIKPADKKRWKLANNIASNTMKFYGTNMLDDPTMGATHYHATYVKPKWRLKFEKTIRIGTHIFYKMENIKGVAYLLKRSKPPKIDIVK